MTHKPRPIHFLLLVILLLATCGPVGTMAPVTTTWFGMQVASDEWQTEELENTLYRHGLLTHRTLTGCRVAIMSMDPVNAGGYNADWENSFHQELKTDTLQLHLWKVRDMDGRVFTTYFEVLDTTGQSGHDLYRLGYFMVEPGEKAVECLDALYGLLTTLQPGLFPDIGAVQG